MKVDVRVLSNWSRLNAALLNMTEEQAKQLLDAELAGQSRRAVLLRIYGRFNSKRARRERRELLRKGK
jgi:hypothetical protein